MAPFFGTPALRRATATACFFGVPEASSRCMFVDTASFDDPLTKGIIQTPRGSAQLMHCEQCKKVVRVPFTRWKTFRFCSRSCGYAWHAAHNRVKQTCKICLTIFSTIKFREKTAKYCSRPCYYKAMSKVGTITLNCAVCQASIRRPPSRVVYQTAVCSPACRALLSRTPHPGSPSSCRVWLNARGAIKECERCRYNKIPEILVIHHKDRNRKNNLLTNLEVLCPNCHAAEHYASPL